jgi:predicted flap endonuclease-1-like 5' DNA nuclease
MGYVFGKAFWWILLALAVGGVIGWMANGWRRKSWVETSVNSTASADEVERLRHRTANLEGAVAERDAARSRVVELEAALRDCEARASAPVATPEMQGFAAVGNGIAGDDSAPEGVSPELEAPNEVLVAADRFAGVELDLAQASSIIGEKVALDDLKVVEGIGPKIEELLHNGGITTWAALADSPVSHVQDILRAAGERFRVHDPSSWPRQAELLAMGRWEEFKRLTDSLTAGRQ